MKKKILILFVFLLSVHTAVFAAKPAPQKTVKPATTKATTEKSTPIWDNWYAVGIKDLTTKKIVPYSYYNEKFEQIGDRYLVQVHMWKNEEGFINEEHIGAFSKAEDTLRPLFYNFKQTYRSNELTIDGTIDDNGYLTAKIKQAGLDTRDMKRQVPSKAFFSIFFPVWFRLNIDKVKKTSSPVSFLTLQEDNIEQEFKTEAGTVQLDKPDDFAKEKGALKVSLRYQGLNSTWWIKESGEALKIQIPARNLEGQQVSEKEAKSFFSKK